MAKFFSFFSRPQPDRPPGQPVADVPLPPFIGEQGVNLLNLVGYGMLIFGLLNYVMTVIPPQFTNPVWELQIIRRLLDQAGVPLIGFGFVFYRPLASMRRRGLYLLRVLSWLCLVLGLVFLLMLPLAIVNTGRVSLLSQDQTNQQVKVRAEQIDQVEKAIQKGLRPNELRTLAQGLGLAPQKINSPELAKNLLAELQRIRNANQDQALELQSNLRKRSTQDLIKTTIETLGLATLFVLMWLNTAWTR
ncbi:MAG: HpsJ family protein, partial [Pseudanabaenaceae cyanobacterium bins.68]|nr:HpsJ family protein [Pseudanabaenaceae cyanobacterium bins.68]